MTSVRRARRVLTRWDRYERRYPGLYTWGRHRAGDRLGDARSVSWRRRLPPLPSRGTVVVHNTTRKGNTMAEQYAVVLAARQGNAPERVLMNTVTDDRATAQRHADTWTRRHGHGPDGTDRCGWYAYADRVTGARGPRSGSRVRVPSGATW